MQKIFALFHRGEENETKLQNIHLMHSAPLHIPKFKFHNLSTGSLI